jgi:hypothetical protein
MNFLALNRKLGKEHGKGEFVVDSTIVCIKELLKFSGGNEQFKSSTSGDSTVTILTSESKEGKDVGPQNASAEGGKMILDREQPRKALNPILFNDDSDSNVISRSDVQYAKQCS